MKKYTEEELKYYFQTIKEKYKSAPIAWNCRSVELLMFDDDFKADNLDTILDNRKE